MFCVLRVSQSHQGHVDNYSRLPSLKLIILTLFKCLVDRSSASSPLLFPLIYAMFGSFSTSSGHEGRNESADVKAQNAFSSVSVPSIIEKYNLQ